MMPAFGLRNNIRVTSVSALQTQCGLGVTQTKTFILLSFFCLLKKKLFFSVKPKRYYLFLAKKYFWHGWCYIKDKDQLKNHS